MLDASWKPEWGCIYMWLASDKDGNVALFVNNNWGDIPKCLINIPNIEDKINILTDFLYEYGDNLKEYFFRKNGKTILNFYSKFQYQAHISEKNVLTEINEAINADWIRDETLPAYKGVYIYYGLDGYKKGDDYPIGFKGEADMGDYFKYLFPTEPACLIDFPKELRGIIAKTSQFSFAELDLIRNVDINKIFDYV